MLMADVEWNVGNEDRQRRQDSLCEDVACFDAEHSGYLQYQSVGPKLVSFETNGIR
jgi:hypothetical protein